MSKTMQVIIIGLTAAVLVIAVRLRRSYAHDNKNAHCPFCAS